MRSIPAASSARRSCWSRKATKSSSRASACSSRTTTSGSPRSRRTVFQPLGIRMRDPAQATAAALAVTPLFLVADVVKAAEHYRDRFGFQIRTYYGDYGEWPSAVLVRRGFVDIMFKLAASPEQVRPNGAHG